ncbi:hypothetical protein AB0N05_26315 [Nocardia sp. NPDC051030]|uniref:hypothetical protein n=1 Tax=Nocardia sp. NPDC051030 TaxID=3155162 RepID=UPI0034348C19
MRVPTGWLVEVRSTTHSAVPQRVRIVYGGRELSYEGTGSGEVIATEHVVFDVPAKIICEYSADDGQTWLESRYRIHGPTSFQGQYQFAVRANNGDGEDRVSAQFLWRE